MIRAWMNAFGNLSIKYKLFFSYLALILLPLVTFLLVNSFVTERENEKEMVYSAQQTLKQTDSYMEFKTNSVLNVLNMMAMNDEIMALIQFDSERYTDNIGQWIMDEQRLEALFLLAKNNPDVSNVRIYMRQGMVSLSQSEEIRDLGRYADTRWFRQLLDGRNTVEWFGADYFPEENENVIHVVRNIPSDRNLYESIGVIDFEIPQDRIKKILDQSVYTQGTVLAIVNSRNEIVSTSSNAGEHPPNNYMDILSDFSTDNLRQGVLRKQRRDDGDWLVGAQSIEYSDWTLLLITPYADILNLSHKSRKPMIVVFLIIALVTLPLSFLTASSAVKRIKALIVQMRKVRRGDFNDAYIPSGKDEIGELIKNYNYMLGTLAATIEEKYDLGKALKSFELKALQAQINPHFLYNTLDLINWMSVAHKAPAIGAVVEALAKFYKLSLSNGEDTVTVRNELEHVKAYVQIQNLRCDGAIRLNIEVQESILDYPIIKIVLQPIIENAILHGILEKETESGTITIRSETHDRNITLYVQDDGVGMSEEKAARILNDPDSAEERPGYGLKNIDQRLKMHYGEAYGLAFSSQPGQGTLVVVRIAAVQLAAVADTE
ncbi:sensor histidine kinase [Cohnella sp. GCM10020058]|uniref:cache domain-containing sensor histidine kinase n=1 Tax=Cohnella sp. GCM10020058 TaxID=3317330 RepID=UPI00362EE912